MSPIWQPWQRTESDVFVKIKKDLRRDAKERYLTILMLHSDK